MSSVGPLEALGLSVLLTLYLVAFRGYFTASLLCAVPSLLGVTGALLCLVLLGVQTVGVLLVAFVLKMVDRRLVFWLARSDVLPYYAGVLVAFCVFRPGLRLVLRWESARRRLA